MYMVGVHRPGVEVQLADAWPGMSECGLVTCMT